MKNLIYKTALHIYALLPASIQYQSRRLYHRFRPSIPAREAALVWAEYLESNSFEQIKSSFDPHFYASEYGINQEDAWNDYLARGITLGNYINLDHKHNCETSNVNSARQEIRYSFEFHENDRRKVDNATSVPEIFKSPELLSVDLWDTLIRRNRPADAAKLATARRMLFAIWMTGNNVDLDVWDLFKLRVQVEAELARTTPSQEYEITNVLATVLVNLNLDIDSDSLATSLAAIEVDEEIEWSEAIDDVLSLISEINANKTVVASDFYFKSDDLQRIVDSLVPSLNAEKIYSSCEEDSSKRLNGTLLKNIRSTHNVSEVNHVHIGDNPNSDIANQLKFGGKAIAVKQDFHKYVAPGEFSKDTVSLSFEHLDTILENLDAPSAAFKSGQKAAIYAVALVARAIEVAVQNGLTTVHYCSREGAFLQRVHEAVAGSLSPSIKIKSNHVTVSRRATFGPSLAIDSADLFYEDLQRMWSMYGNQSPRAFIVSIGLNPLDYQQSLNERGFVLDQVVNSIASNSEFQNWITQPEVIKQMMEELTRNRNILKQYLDSALNFENNSLVIADIGWRGTIQDNIGKIYSTSNFHGVYLGLFPFLNNQSPIHTKQAVVFDGNKGEKYYYAEPPAAIERPWTPHIPSVVKFIEGDNGKALAVTEIEDDSVSENVVAFQEGTLDASLFVANWMVAHGFTSNVIQPQLQKRLENYYQDPDTAVAGIWFDSSHDDTFGALNQTTFGKFRPDRTWIENPNQETLNHALANSNWPSGYVAWQPVKALLSLVPTLKGVK